jgi:hypothetical protein
MFFNDYSNNEQLQVVACTSSSPDENTIDQSPVDSRKTINEGQDNLPLFSGDYDLLLEQLDHLATKMEIDPWSKYILDTAYKVLAKLPKFSIDQLVDSMDGGENAPVKEGTLRKKLKTLVGLRLLNSIPGQGRTPTYYFLPEPQQLNELLIDDQESGTDNSSCASQDIEEMMTLKRTLSIYEEKKECLLHKIKEKESWIEQAKVTFNEYDLVIQSIAKELNYSPNTK